MRTYSCLPEPEPLLARILTLAAPPERAGFCAMRRIQSSRANRSRWMDLKRGP